MDYHDVNPRPQLAVVGLSVVFLVQMAKIFRYLLQVEVKEGGASSDHLEDLGVALPIRHWLPLLLFLLFEVVEEQRVLPIVQLLLGRLGHF